MKTTSNCLLLIIALILNFKSFSQINFQKAYGLLPHNTCYSAKQNPDGTYIISGRETWNSANRCCLMKLDVDGDTLWTKIYGDSSTYSGHLFSVIRTHDNYFVATGVRGEPGISAHCFVLKTDINGNLIWCKNYSGTGFTDGWGQTILETDDGNYIVGGYENIKGLTLLKIDPAGSVLFAKNYGSSTFSVASFCYLSALSDGGFVLIGTRSAPAGSQTNILAVRTDGSGNLIWMKEYGGSLQEEGFSIHETVDGNLMMQGVTNSFGAGNRDVLLIKTDMSGNIIWSKTYGDTNNNWAASMVQTPNGDFVIRGTTNGMDSYFIKVDLNGDTLWTKAFNTRAWGSYLGEISLTSDSGFVIGGMTNLISNYQDQIVLKTDSAMNSLSCMQQSCFTTIGVVSCVAIDTGYVTNVTATYSIGITNVRALTPFVYDLCFSTDISSPLISNDAVFPNPFSSELNIKLSGLSKTSITIRISDVYGRTVYFYEEKQGFGDYNKTLFLNKLVAGTYIIDINTNERRLTKHIIKFD